MSQILHRQRLRARKAAAATSRLAGFRPVGGQPAPTARPRPKPPAVPVVDTPVVDVNVVKPPADLTPPAAVETATAQPLPDVPVVVPTDLSDSTQPVVPEQAKATAEMLAQLPTDQYRQALGDMQNNNPALYAAVVAELNAMNAATTTEDDGADLSALTSDQSA